MKGQKFQKSSETWDKGCFRPTCSTVTTVTSHILPKDACELWGQQASPKRKVTVQPFELGKVYHQSHQSLVYWIIHPIYDLSIQLPFINCSITYSIDKWSPNLYIPTSTNHWLSSSLIPGWYSHILNMFEWFILERGMVDRVRYTHIQTSILSFFVALISGIRLVSSLGRRGRRPGHFFQRKGLKWQLHVGKRCYFFHWCMKNMFYCYFEGRFGGIF